jgi:hypothetical protein
MLIILELPFSPLAFSVKLRLSGVSCVKYCKLSDVSANVAFPILRVNMVGRS